MKKCRGVKGNPCIVTDSLQDDHNFYSKRNYCKVCNTSLRRLRYQEDPSVILATNKKSYEKNKESWSVAKNTYNRGRYTENIEEERKRRSDWKKNNRHLVCAQSAHRRAKQNSATPPWLTKEHCEQIKLIYSHARECEMLTGDKYHVDHITPLNGEDVSGLHVPWNLQVLPADINIAKSNKH